MDEILDLVATMQNDSGTPAAQRGGDRRDGRVYAYSPEIVLAIQVALITSRPLLLSGPPGCGKSSLASFVARNLGFSYYEFVADAEAVPQDLLWRLDVIRRLNDAQHAGIRQDEVGEKSILDYIDPGPLWWALNPDWARRRGRSPEVFERLGSPSAAPPNYMPDHCPSRSGAVLLIDEIDKADSNFPNGLLVPLGSRQFHVPEADLTVPPDADAVSCSPLVIITTNNEKELPDAFIRRCVALSIPRPNADQLMTAARLHFPALTHEPELQGKVASLAERFDDDSSLVATPPSTAEFLDLVGTLITLNMDVNSEEWKLVERLVVEKPAAHGALPPSRF